MALNGAGPYDGEYVFMDLMPQRWRHYRVTALLKPKYPKYLKQSIILNAY